MPLAPGTRLGVFEILAPIGKGGMGEVYRARDTKLEREVAVKILPEQMAERPERMARFQREAKLLAALDHPHIAAIHGLHEEAGQHFLVMELVEGKTLADRLSGGPLPGREALEVGVQIAEALEAAHAKDIVHRDLKPANVMLSSKGDAMVLDFGLAKALDDDPANDVADASESPTVSARASRAGAILGTAAYMSPEQARGGPVDERTDIWAFGVVLFEMLTGSNPFRRGTASDTIAAVLESDPLQGRLPRDTPPGVRRLLRRCLERNSELRLQDMGDGRIELLDTLRGEEDVGVTDRPVRRTPQAVTGLLCLVAGGLLGIWLAGSRQQSAQAEPETSRFLLPLREDAPITHGDPPESSLSISPDGQWIAYIGGKDWWTTHLYLRELGAIGFRQVAGTAGARQPFFSPDSSAVGFFTRGGELRTLPLTGGEPVTIARDIAGAGWAFGSWAEDDTIFLTAWDERGLMRVPAGGGTVESVAGRRDNWSLAPHALPGASHVLYTVVSDEGPRIVARDLERGIEHTVVDQASAASYVEPDLLVFARDGVPMVAAFDVHTMQVERPPRPLGERARIDSPILASAMPLLAVSRNGTLVFAPEDGEPWRGTLAWVSREGHAEPISARDAIPSVAFLELAPAETSAAVAYREGRAARIDIFDLGRGVSTPFYKSRSLMAVDPTWYPGGQQLASATCGPVACRIFRLQVDGVGEPQTLGERASMFGVSPWALSAGGRYLAYSNWDPSEGETNNIHFLPLVDGEEPISFTNPAFETQVAFSPDGNWVAYSSDESGHQEIYVRRFPGGMDKRKVSPDGGWAPLWSVNGDELFFQSFDGDQMWAAPIRTTPSIDVGPARLLFEGSFRRSTDVGLSYDVSRDGRFLMIQERGDDEITTELVLVQGWADSWSR